MWDYSDKVKQHFFNPSNAKQVENANATGDVGSISCGDALRLTLKINDETGMIEDAGFQTFGCGSAIASSSVLTEMVIGKHIDEALKVTNKDIANELDGLPPEKMHCSVMGMEALHAAIANYRGETVADDHEEGDLICRCFAIDDVLIRKVVKENQLSTLEDVIHYTKAGGACSSCHEKIEWLLEEILGTIPQAASSPSSTPTTAAKTNLTLVEKIKVIELTLNETIRPILQRDGGDVTLIDLQDDMVFVELTGACVGCGLVDSTVAMIEQHLNQALPEPVTVFVQPAKSLFN